MPCSPNDIHIDIPSGPSGSPIPSFGTPFALNIPSINVFPKGFPEDLLELFNKLQMLLPSGILKPALSVNFGKDIFDAVLSLMDKFLPFLMLYKFFLPVLNLIICIIEVLCALKNPFKLIKAIRRLFRKCLPDFLNLFPIFALIVMLISLLLLLLALIEYIIAQVLRLILAIIRNIVALGRAMKEANANSILAIAKKIGALLCVFQNLFALLSLFSVIIQVIQDILSLAFSIPPCDSSDAEGCCTTEVCPEIVNNNYTRTTGTLKYLNELDVLIPGMPAQYSSLGVPIRTETWQLYDEAQEIAQQFINIVDAYDIPPTVSPKPVFFPTDSSYNAQTAPNQAAYLLDLRMFYNPASWGRAGLSRWIRFNDCVMIYAPTRNLSIFDGNTIYIPNGVVELAGGSGIEDDGTKLIGFEPDGKTPLTDGTQATLENFLHQPKEVSVSPIALLTDGYVFSDVEYVFKPSFEVLFSKDLVTAGCDPGLALDKNFVNQVFAGDANLKFNILGNLVNGPNFPNPNKAVECMSAAISAFKSNVTLLGAAQMQATMTVCLDDLKQNTEAALNSLIALGVDPCASDFTLEPTYQFTSKPIKITVNLKDRNKMLLTNGISTAVASSLDEKLKAYTTLGAVSPFEYDGYSVFTADLISDKSGDGNLMVSFDDNIFCTNTIPTDLNTAPSHDLQVVNFKFVYSPGLGADGKPRRDESDLSDSNKDGS